MNAFTYKEGQLFAEDVSVSQLAEEHGTPLYIYSKSHIVSQYDSLVSAMSELDPIICYSVKANSNHTVIKTLIEKGSGVDIVSGGELFRALKAGVDPLKVVFAGVGKTVDEIDYAIEQNILFFSVESEQEAVRISEQATKLGKTARIAFRINPDVDPKTHKYISTGKKENKFGLDLERAAKAYEVASGLPGIEIAGLQMHIGSQLLGANPFEEALLKIRDLCDNLKAKYDTFQYLDIGGGIGIQYSPEQVPLEHEVYAQKVIPQLKELGLKVILEPGRNLVGNAGILLCRVQYVKDNPFKKFIVVDAGMNDLIRPSLYQAHHEVVAVAETSETVHGDLVGPICESGDFTAADRDLPDVAQGALLAIKSAGAYGFTMASNYNSRPRAAEIMVDGDKATVIRKRETWEDIVAKEVE